MRRVLGGREVILLTSRLQDPASLLLLRNKTISSLLTQFISLKVNKQVSNLTCILAICLSATLPTRYSPPITAPLITSFRRCLLTQLTKLDIFLDLLSTDITTEETLAQYPDSRPLAPI